MQKVADIYNAIIKEQIEQTVHQKNEILCNAPRIPLLGDLLALQ
jgi:hypothetical protein